MTKKIELLAPAGGMRQLEAAVRYGADAVYLGLKRYGLRAHSSNFTPDELHEAVRLAHKSGVLVYLTLNIFAFDEDIAPMLESAGIAREIGVDGVIVADVGVVCALHEAFPDLPVHLSTQANVTNTHSARFYHAAGASRIVLSREMSLDRIADMRRKLPDELELETFVHGAVCMSYSGRCALSKYMTGRDANRGDCAQPCRWKYQLLEEKRPGQLFPVDQNAAYTQIFSAGDMCMVEHLPELVDAGVTSLKIEGRMKNEYYVATVVSVYRRALDACLAGKPLPEGLVEELNTISHRPYDTGFYFGPPTEPGGCEGFTQSMEYAARVERVREDGLCEVLVKNQIYRGDRLELLSPAGVFSFKADWPQEDAFLRAGSTLPLALPPQAQEGDILRGVCRNHLNA